MRFLLSGGEVIGRAGHWAHGALTAGMKRSREEVASPSRKKGVEEGGLGIGLEDDPLSGGRAAPMLDDGEGKDKHVGNKLLCEQCGLSFALRSALAQHNRVVHEGRRDFACAECGSRFTTKGSLKTHVKTVHEKRLDFECKICLKKFAEKSNMVKHVARVHERERAFKCDICNKLFAAKQTLQTHVRIVHEKVKMPKVKCLQCGKMFCDRSTLNRHVKTVHNKIKEEKCMYCNYRCARKHNLEKHIAALHSQVGKDGKNSPTHKKGDGLEDPVGVAVEPSVEPTPVMQDQVEH